MPSPKSHRKSDQEKKNKKGKSPVKASSFHGRRAELAAEMLPRPRTVPDLLAGGAKSPAVVHAIRPKLTKLLINVTVHRSLGAVQIVMLPENTVSDLITAVLRQYAKEGRRPTLSCMDPSGFDLHYSQFSLESLDREEKLMALGSRNFFLFPKKKAETEVESGGATTSSTSRCSKDAEKIINKAQPWLKFYGFFAVN